MTAQVFACDFVVIDDMLWFVPMDYSYLCCYDRKQHKVIRRIALPISKRYCAKRGYFEKILYSEGYIVGIPYWADYVFVYSIGNDSLDIIRVPDGEDDRLGSGYYASFINGHSINAFLRTSHFDSERNEKILSINILDKKTRYVHFSHSLGVDQKIYANSVIRRSYLQFSDRVFLLFGNKNIVLEYCADKIEVPHAIGSEGARYTTICSMDEDGSAFLLSDNDGQAVIWNKRTNDIECINLHVSDNVKDEERQLYIFYEMFSFSIRYKNRIFLFPYMAERVVEFDIQSKICTTAKFSNDVCCDVSDKVKVDSRYCFGQFSEPHMVNNELIVWNLWSGNLYTINLDTNDVNVQSVFVSFEKDDFVDEWEKTKRINGIFEEDDRNVFMTLNGLIEGTTVSPNSPQSSFSSSSGTIHIGQEIYDFVKG